MMSESEHPADAATDEALVARVIRGETEAFGTLVLRYEAKLLRYGRTFLRNPADLQDLVQDTFIKAYENIRSFDTTQRFSPWIYRIAHNTFVNRLRRESGNPVAFLDLDAVLPHVSMDATQETEHEEAQTRALVLAGIEKIPQKYREVLSLHYFENLSYKEIAEVLRLPLGTVGIRLARARAALKKTFPASYTLSS